MNAIPSNMVEMEKNNTEVVHEIDEGIVEVGAVVADTKGWPLPGGFDNGFGYYG